MQSRELFRSEDGRITVDEAQGVVSLRFNGRLQSSICRPGGIDTAQPYLDFLHLPLAVVPDATRVLIVGLGGGVLPKRMLHDYTDMRIDAVELDPEVIEISHRFFGLPVDPRLTVTVGDGRDFIERTNRRYDIIIVDAYHEAELVPTFTTIEFIRMAANRLTPGGALAYNVVGALTGAGSQAFHRLLRGLECVFRNRYVFPVGVSCGGRAQNIVVIAANSEIEAAALKQRIRARVGGRVRVPGFDDFADHLLPIQTPQGISPFSDAELAGADSTC